MKLYVPTAGDGIGAQYALALGLADGYSLRRDLVSTEVFPLIVDAVARDPNALGILDWTAYSLSKSRVRALQMPDPSALSYPMNLYVSASALSQSELREFVVYMLSNAQRLVESANLRAFTLADYQKALSQVASVR